MACKCNQPSENWWDIEFVKKLAQKVANIKDSEQTIFKTKNGYLFNDTETYYGNDAIIVVKPEQ